MKVVYSLQHLKKGLAHKLQTGALILSDIKWGDLQLQYQKLGGQADVVIFEYGEAGKIMKNRFGDYGDIFQMDEIMTSSNIRPKPRGPKYDTFDPVKLRGRLLALRADVLNQLNGHYVPDPRNQLEVINFILLDFYHITFPEYDSPSITLKRDLPFDAKNNLLGPNDWLGHQLREMMIEQGIIDG